MTRTALCPFCDLAAGRPQVHAHMVQAHPESMEAWRDAASGRMHYRVVCPTCGDRYEKRVKPRSRDADFLEQFAGEVRMVAFDMLLNHIEAEHAGDAAGDIPPAPAELPDAGPSGGRGRPGAGGVPLPPGMQEQDVAAPALHGLIEAHTRRRRDT